MGGFLSGLTSSQFLVQGGAPPDDSVTTAKVVDDAITTAKVVDDAITLAKLAAGTDGELITWDASGDPAAVAVGTATHVLTSNGAGAAPTFQAGGGGWAFVSKIVASTDATVSFENQVAGFDYLYIIEGVLPDTDSRKLSAKLGIAGVTYRAANYAGVNISIPESTVTPTALIELAAISQGNAADEHATFEFLVINPVAATDTFYQFSGMDHNYAGAGQYLAGGGHHTTAEAMVATQFFYSANNVSVGNFYQYKRANA
jgi:hypothetical protein